MAWVFSIYFPSLALAIINADTVGHRDTFIRYRTTDFDLNVAQLKPTAQMQQIKAGKQEPSPQAAGSALGF